MRRYHWLALALLALPLGATERKFDFSEMREGQTPPGFRSTVLGQGKPGDWKVFLDDVPPLLPPLNPQAPSVSKRAVLAQSAQDPTDEHFPLLIYDGDDFGDVTLTTRFKTVRGTAEQMAGVVFHLQNETNFYVVRASSLGNNLRFYKVLNGERGPLVGPEVPVTAGVWHELTIECKGNQIRCLLEGKELINVTDKVNPFTSGKIGFWTKSDSVSYFGDTSLVYKPRELVSQNLIRQMIKRYPRVIGLEIYAPGSDTNTTRLVASQEGKDIGKPGGETEQRVIHQGATYYGKDRTSVSVTMPLRDRNGDAIAAVRVVMKSFTGQTEQNAILKALPVVKDMQARLQSMEDLN